MFQEVERNGVPYFVFEELDRVQDLVHCFTSRATDQALEASGVATQRPRLAQALGLPVDGIAPLEQIHSASVIECVPRPRTDGLAGPADGWLLNRRGCFGAIRSADCLPILAVLPKRGQGCVLHAGWRGTRDRIASRGVGRLLEETGADPCEVLIGLGPAIRACCYEVGDEVRTQFAKTGQDTEAIFRGSHLDLISANRSQLEQLGVRGILDSEMCTVCRPDLFYSHRRDRDPRRMWAILGFR